MMRRRLIVVTRGSTDSGQRIADEHVDDAGAAERGQQHDDAPAARRAISPIDGRVAPERMGAQGGERGVGLDRARRPRRACPRWRHTADRCREGRRRRSPPAPPATSFRPGRRRGRCRGPVRCRPCRHRPGSDRAASGSQGAAAMRASTSPPSGAVSERMSASRARSPRASITAMPWSAMVPETSTTSPGCTCSGPSVRPAGITPTPAVVMYMPSAAPRFDDLGVAGDDGDAGGGGGRGHVGDDLAQLVDREALFDHERRRQPRRPRARPWRDR